MSRALKDSLTDEEKKIKEEKKLAKKQAKLLQESQESQSPPSDENQEKPPEEKPPEEKPPEEKPPEAPVGKKKIKLLMPIFDENIGLVIDENYTHYHEYAQLIETKAKRQGSFFAEYVG